MDEENNVATREKGILSTEFDLILNSLTCAASFAAFNVERKSGVSNKKHRNFRGRITGTHFIFFLHFSISTASQDETT